MSSSLGPAVLVGHASHASRNVDKDLWNRKGSWFEICSMAFRGFRQVLCSRLGVREREYCELRLGNDVECRL
jgi:hypothetical protein